MTAHLNSEPRWENAMTDMDGVKVKGKTVFDALEYVPLSRDHDSSLQDHILNARFSSECRNIILCDEVFPESSQIALER